MDSRDWALLIWDSHCVWLLFDSAGLVSDFDLCIWPKLISGRLTGTGPCPADAAGAFAVLMAKECSLAAFLSRPCMSRTMTLSTCISHEDASVLGSHLTNDDIVEQAGAVHEDVLEYE